MSQYRYNFTAESMTKRGGKIEQVYDLVEDGGHDPDELAAMTAQELEELVNEAWGVWYWEHASLSFSKAI